MHRSPLRVVLLGPPGVGKGTQAKLLSEKTRACHLSTGDLFRCALGETAASPAMRAASEAMRRGELVSDDLVIELVRERGRCLRCRGGFLLDGFPRTKVQAEALEGLLDELDVRLDAAVLFALPTETIVARLSGRRTCGACQAVFHLTSQPPAVSGICDDCGGRLIQRDDDRPQTVRVRMQAYERQIQPLVDFYASRGKLCKVDAVGSPDSIVSRTLETLDRRKCSSVL